VLNSRTELARLVSAGFESYYAGIEHLSTSILRLMSKGITGLQAIRFLKWAAELGIKVTWNIICGYPGEDPSEYDRIASLVPRVVHLSPPYPLMPLVLGRSSNLWDDPAAAGIRLLPPDSYGDCLVCDDGDVLGDLVPARDFEWLAQPHPSTYVGRCREAVTRWIENGAAYRALHLERGPDFVRIVDGRVPSNPRRILLEGPLAAVYLACADGPTMRDLMARIDSGGEYEPDEEALADMLAQFEEAGLLYSERGRFLALALDFRL